MSDDPHPCMKVTSHIRNFYKMSATAVHIQEQNVLQFSSDDESNSSSLILNAENIAAKNLNHKDKSFSDDLRPYLLVPNGSRQASCINVGKAEFIARRFLHI